MIEMGNLSTLFPAEEVAKTADTAIYEQERAAVARAVNSSANTGELRTVWNYAISDELMDDLKKLGYRVVPQKDPNGEVIPNVYVIWSR